MLNRNRPRRPAIQRDNDIGGLLRLFHCSGLSHCDVDDAAATEEAVVLASWSAMREEWTGRRLPGDAGRRFADDITGFSR